MNWKCFFTDHDWVSKKIGALPSRFDVVGNVAIMQNGRTFWDNACQRCGKVVEMTYQYGRDETEGEMRLGERCLVCTRATPFDDVDENERAGWRVQLEPVKGWLCPEHNEPHEDELRLSEFYMTLDADTSIEGEKEP